MTCTVSDLLDLLEQDYLLHGRATLRDFRYRRRHIDDALGELPAAAVHPREIAAYKLERTRAGARPATCNNELAWLRRAYRIAVEDELLHAAPKIRLFPQSACGIRTDYLEVDDFERLLGELVHDPVGDLADYLYHSGWRLGEAAALEWSSVRETAIVVTETKEQKLSKRGRVRVLPLVGRLATILDRRRTVRDPHSHLVFHRDGRPIGDFRKRWRSALRRAGLERVTVHSLRRSFVRNALSAGLDESVVQRFTGHRTLDMLRRYNVLSERQIADAAERLDRFRLERLAVK